MDRTRIPERDWKLLSQLTPVALERFCARVLAEAARITAAPGMTSHERYLKLYGLIQQQDRDLAFAFNDHRRSTALVKTARLHALGLLTEDELGAFTEETRETVSFLLSLEAKSS
jgi:hypothetical protein